MLATASDKGTVIRVFSLPNGDRVHEFRRGTYPAKIYSISFNQTSTLLSVSSDTETVHIFKLGNGRSGKGVSMASDYDDDGGRYSGDGQSAGYEAFAGSGRKGGNDAGGVG